MSRSNTAKKKQKHAIAILSRCICKTTQYLSIKQDINQNCLKLPNEMSTQEVVKDCASLMEVIDSGHALIIILNLIQMTSLTKT